MCTREFHDLHGCRREPVFPLFSVVKRCILAVEKQWFGVLEGFANVHAHLLFLFVFAFCALKNVHFSWGAIACPALTPLRGCCFSERLAAVFRLHHFLLVSVASLEKRLSLRKN